jgi:hypothetical protein
MACWQKGLLAGLSTFIGIGPGYDPMGELRSELASKTQEYLLNNTENALNFAKAQSKFNESAIQYINVTNKKLQSQFGLFQQQTNQQFQQTNLNSLFFFITILIVILYLVINT